MENVIANRYQDVLKRYSPAPVLTNSLKMSEGPRGLSTYYAPFDYVNREARLVICGITPGMKQAGIALATAATALMRGAHLLEALQLAKGAASFAGAMRTNMAAMLDHVGANQLLGIESCESLFGKDSGLVHYTSALRYPVFKQGANYSGDSDMVNEPYLWTQSAEYLRQEVEALPSALWLPLGSSVVQVFERMVREGWIAERQVLFGMPHASGANAERIKYFIGKKERSQLSTKVNPDLLDQRKLDLVRKIRGLAASVPA